MAVQPVSPQPLGAQRAVAESPSPPPSAAAVALVTEQCTVSHQEKQTQGAAVISLDVCCGVSVDTVEDQNGAAAGPSHLAETTVGSKGKSHGRLHAACWWIRMS